jgi:hypothetical protein
MTIKTNFACKPLPLGWLPNKVGYKFIGVLRDSTTKECEVVFREVISTNGINSLIHTVNNYEDLVGWYRSV